MSDLEFINPREPSLLPHEAAALSRMLQKREDYLRRGLDREAHGATAAILILWRCLIGDIPFSIDSMNGGL